MKVATLVLIKSRDGKQVLLARKKEAEIGSRLINAPGGKLEPEDRGSLRRCARREVLEEFGIQLEPMKLEKVALLECYAAGAPSMEVYVFETDEFLGEPRETSSCEKPEWHDIESLPFSEMHEGDEHWMKMVLQGQKVNALLFYKGKGEGFERVVFRPFTG